MAEGLGGIPSTLGSLIGGCMVSVGLSAIVGIQTFLYFRLFPMDTLPFKLLVAWVWITDAGHTIALLEILPCVRSIEKVKHNHILGDGQCIPGTYLFSYEFITNNRTQVNVIITLIATLNANLFYTWRIHKMSKYNWWLTGPICVLCVTRTGLGLFTTTELHVLWFLTKTWINMAAHFQANVIAGLAVSAGTDIVISTARYYYLRDLKQGYMANQEMMDTVVILTINDGIITSATAIACIACVV
ncbi:hypothetical protein B0H19DRAFT_1267291 [Mycena capillaripes]|nr:hypothetical protein B0H19DRAFT_1267291 [Mycena capillaripes]